MSFQEHKQQTAAELAQLHTAITTSQSGDYQLELEENLQFIEALQKFSHQLQTVTDGLYAPYTCGGTGGWRRVAYIDMTDPSAACPSGWKLTGYSKRTCGAHSRHGQLKCDSVIFPVSGGKYSKVCGRIKAYQWGGDDAFLGYYNGRVNTIDDAYASGVSVTHGRPRHHIWTFVVGLSEGNPTFNSVCPCDASINIRVPSFVGNDYFCESGVNEPWDWDRHYTFHSDDTLWDGKDCLPSSTCCSLNNPPYFVKQLPASTADDIEARICLYDGLAADNIAVELVDLYVK